MAEVQPAAEKQRTEASGKVKNPRSIITWNCNGFISRCNWNASAMKKLLEETDYPDMVCVQEARLKAFDAHNRGLPLPSEYALVQETTESSVFQDYEPIWSLADNRYAGTLTLLHKRFLLDSSFDVKSRCAFSVDGAVDLMLQRFQLTRTQVGGLAPAAASSSAAAAAVASHTKQKVIKQTSMKSFFAPKPKPAATVTKNDSQSSSTTSPSFSNTGAHHSEGRFQFFSFDDMDVLQTYVPNNGTKEDSFRRRKEWDETLLQFLKDRRNILQHSQQVERPLLWCGDLNVARDFRDGTHWERRDDGSIYEFWAECNVAKKGTTVPEPENIGIPSFTPAERNRFAALLKEGDFVDIWRELHPIGVTNSMLARWDRPDYTVATSQRKEQATAQSFKERDKD